MKCAILTCSTPNRKWLYDITNPTKQKYCEKYGYTYIFSDTYFPDKSRHPYWNKIAFVRDYLEQFDSVIWLDDDAGFIKYDRPLTELIASNFGYCEDINGLNCGVFSVKSTDENLFIFNYIWTKGYSVFHKNKFPEQDALKYIYQKSKPQLSTKLDGSIYNAYDERIIVSNNKRTEDTLILHIAAGSKFKEQNKDFIRDLYEHNL